MIFGLDGKRVNREGARPHWDLYRRALQERPDLIANLEHSIRAAIDAHLRSSTVVNSSWLGSELLDTFARRREWGDYVPDTRQSSGLFGMVLWTVLFDDVREWTSTIARDPRTGEEQRHYVLRIDHEP